MNEEDKTTNTDSTETNPVTDPANEIEGAYASNPALRPDANKTNITGATGSATGTNATGSGASNSTGINNATQTIDTSSDGEQVSVERENPVTDPVNEVGGAYASNPALQPTENERREGETEEQRLNRLRDERQREVPERESDRGGF